MPLVAQGAPATINLTVRNSTGDLTDPTNISLTIRDSMGDPLAGFPVAYGPGPVVKDGVGQYHYIWTVPALQAIDSYTALWGAILLGAPETAQETWEVVAPGSLSTSGLDFLVSPDDYDAIRGLLGVTTLDVEDSQIDFVAFAPHAELLVKRRISNWADQILDPTQLLVLRLATIYQVACLMANSYVRGGTIGMVRPLSVGEGRDWAQEAANFCAQYEYWLNIADQSDDPDESDAIFDIHPLRVNGPTRVRIARRRAGLYTFTDPAALPWYRYPPFVPE